MRPLSSCLLITSCAFLGYSVLATGGQANPKKTASPKSEKRKKIEFNRDVRPILAEHCFTCHGADKEANKRTGNMRLDSFEGATADRGGYRAIVPGDPEKSILLSRVTADIPEMRMPPVDSDAKPLTTEEKAILKQWIAEGAGYEKHWAFIPPRMPEIPKVSNPAWVKNDIDRFIMAGLDAAKLKPAPQADRVTQIRRVTLTLTGLPPTPAEVNAFLADSHPDAYDRVVDRLLASPRYGENQARFWLDAVRYADTHGLHIDNERAVYPYRDWVIRAYNEDLPFDKFALWQLAGDMLPKPTIEQLIATGYIRMNPTTNEGGVIEAEFLAKNTMDRVDTTATVFLGVTMGCAKCHDHKYDPISAKEYYGMYAFFNSTVDTPLDGNARLHAPVMKAPTPEQEERLSAFDKLTKGLEDSVSMPEAKQWFLANAPLLPKVGDWQVAGPFAAKDFESAFTTEFGPETAKPDTKWRAFKVELDKVVPGVVGKENASGYLKTTLIAEKAQELMLRLGSDDGIRVWVNGALVHDNKIARGALPDSDLVKIKLTPGANSLLVKIVNGGGEDGVFVGLGDANVRRLSRARELVSQATLTSQQSREVAASYLALGPSTAASEQYKKATIERKALDDQIPYTYIAQEMSKPRVAHLLKRGEYNLLGDVTPRMVPKAFGSMSTKLPKNRLGLAEWITDPKNPLVARVFVNRVWQQHFGTGIVKSSEDFGNRGDWPSNPELLDYLAVKFVKDGWSLKKLHRMIVTSATFRQSAVADKAKVAKDPENKLLSRAPRFRLDAEVIRDTSLFVSGLLVERPGGHGDKPYQPSGLWEAIAYPSSDTAKYMQDHGDALYRRSVYLFWKRTSPPPTMLLFDAPMREACVVRRSATNTPTQALATMNETGFFEAARMYAQRVLQTKQDDASRLDYAFRLVLGRRPTKEEQGVVMKLLNSEREVYRARPGDALKALRVGESPRDESLDPAEHAAWMIICNMILNTDESLTQH